MALLVPFADIVGADPPTQQPLHVNVSGVAEAGVI
jgi:hypothetical protein